MSDDNVQGSRPWSLDGRPREWWVDYLAHVHAHRAQARRTEAALCFVLGGALLALAAFVAAWGWA